MPSTIYNRAQQQLKPFKFEVSLSNFLNELFGDNMNCTNNDLDARDRRGASCESGYTSDTYYCGVFDDEDFSAFEHCYEYYGRAH